MLQNARIRLLGLDFRVIRALMAGVVITLGILFLQQGMRAGAGDLQSLRIFRRLFLVEDYPATFLLIVSLVAALSPSVQRAGMRLADAMGSRPLLTCHLAFVAFATGALTVYHRHPLSMDEYAPYLQSQVFAAGELTGRFRVDILDWLVWPDFLGLFVHVNRDSGAVASAYWPGFALLMAPFTMLGVPWLCNPTVGAAGLWLVHRLAYEITGSHRAAGTAMLLSLGSAAYTVYSISFYSMAAHLACNALFALLLLRPTVARCVAAGLTGGLALNLHNPVPHLFFAMPWLCWLAWRRDWKAIAALSIGYLPWIVVGFGWHQLLHSLAGGRPVAGSVGGRNPAVEALRIFVGVFELPPLERLLARLIELAKLWLWSAPGLILLAAGGYRHCRNDTRWQLLIASMLTTFLGYLFIPLDQGHGWGFRYFQSTWFVLPLLAAVAAEEPTKPGWPSGPLTNYGAGLGLVGLVVMTPLFAYQVHRFITAHLGQFPTAEEGRPQVAIVSVVTGYYAQDLVQNDAFLQNPPIVLVSRGRTVDAEMMAEKFPHLELLSSSYHGTVWGIRTGQALDPHSK